ncbi:hypothetical protein [Flavilitoribacter nigricans]|uniref:Uncharacterized protein n=1 Tax=Flavilitoribacter nigricans (strain ATCC 23147 / DSM 23189 / NBRC 102662 / NCIMB 1420 / SS-2) TaxID=1122177 RepID=A0A2D0NG40_FLAN2|nr:hypothetical protein [Flavilitoribacter nigricans]PHN07472.1 hypothetical protein CRP01_05050 [Flavilitoribacter nigricans DSM 23189 = NBRC 102662]
MPVREVKLNKNGGLPKSQIDLFGGEYSFTEKLRKFGTGSPKLIYESGISEFDQLDRGSASELGFVNLELLKNGLLFWFNQNQRIKCVGIKLTEIQAINLVAFRIELKYRRQYGKTIKRIVYRGELEILDTTRDKIIMNVIVQNFKGILKFFQKEPFDNKFSYSLSLDPPEKDYDYLIDWLGNLL